MVAYCGEFMGLDYQQTYDATEIIIDKNFVKDKPDPQYLTALQSSWMNGGISTEEYRRNLIDSGVSLDEVNRLTDDQTGGNQPPIGQNNE